jgi:hypothetical protein
VALPACLQHDELWLRLLARDHPASSHLVAPVAGSWRQAYQLEQAGMAAGRLRCCYSGASFRQAVLGLPLQGTNMVQVVAPTRLRSKPRTMCPDLISLEAFEAGVMWWGLWWCAGG